MTITLKMLAPAGAIPATVTDRAGNSYTPDAFGIVSVPAGDASVDLLRGGWTLAGITQARNNLAASADPGATNDNTQDFAPGSLWMNTTNNRLWSCQSAGTGAAVWYLAGVVPGLGSDPASMITAFGGGTNSFTEEGNLYRALSAAGVGNNADTTDDILFGFQLSAGSFDILGRGLCITAQGKTATNTNNKRAKIIFGATLAGSTVTNGVITGGSASGGTVIADTGAWVNGTTANSNVGWQLMTNVFKYGAAGSNTQYAQGTLILGAVHGGVALPSFPTVVESGVINVVLTGSSYTTGAANDVLANFLEINAMN